MNTELRTEINSSLLYFTGSEQLWEHKTFIGKLYLTDGCNYLRDKAQCRWFFDLIKSYQPKLKNEEFQKWVLERVSDMDFLITCDDGNDNILVRQKIPFSDFPLTGITVWKVDEVVMLPREY
ncbi:MAG: hypothetical protein QNK23_14400 [Crocinitomicaceae bacterium]|nr:hypothetical protein [Crocinitomicaceae bacterium]